MGGAKASVIAGDARARVRGMNVALRQPRMTRGQFFQWAQAQGGRYEFDGFQPVAMTGGSLNHNRIALNINRALFSRLEGSGCEPFGPDAGIATVGNTVRYPDAVVTCAQDAGEATLVPDPLVVFEVLSPSSGKMDRFVKVREYRAVGSIRRYVIVESTAVALTVLSRSAADDDWTLRALLAGEDLHVPELGFTLPLTEVYRGTGLPEAAADEATEA